ncbi:P27 family phage terminase small subunit [Paraburkholderia sp. EG286A]|uniref:P27 family phage terminase small subunit n=1 Tax=Paraburkholderia sp. EG286A TaxID=3237014 RepID=UPI0034D1A634
MERQKPDDATRDATGRLLPPATLDARAKEIFNSIVGSWPGAKFKRSDLLTLTALVHAHVLHADMVVTIAREGAMLKGRGGGPREHPACRTQRRAASTIANLTSRLGLSGATDHRKRDAARRDDPVDVLRDDLHHEGIDLDALPRDGLTGGLLVTAELGALAKRHPGLYFVTASDLSEDIRGPVESWPQKRRRLEREMKRTVARVGHDGAG